MGNLSFFENMINRQMLDLHTAYLAKVISITSNKATIQPLGLIKEIEGTAKEQAVIKDVPITYSGKYKISVSGGSVTATPTKSGDIVLCVVCDRNITAAKKGRNVLPPYGHHSLSDSVIIGVIV